MGVPTPRIRTALDQVPAYRPGLNAPAPDVFKSSSNENPYPPLPAVREALASTAAEMNRYPDMGVTRLLGAVAADLGVPEAHIAAGTGSVGVLQQLVVATCEAGDEVVYAWPSFEAYPILTALAGARSVRVPLGPGERHDLEAMAASVTDKTRLVLLCSPNNPTGPVIHRAELRSFLDAVPAQVVVAIDEAYHEFVRDPDAADGLREYRERPNVVVLRTFSKAYGLAGLRVGYGVAAEPVATGLRKTALPFGVNSLAETAAVVSLQHKEQLLDRVDALVAERGRVYEALASMGAPVAASEANFVWLSLGGSSPAFASACADAGVLVRAFEAGVRITISEPTANDRVLQVASEGGVGW